MKITSTLVRIIWFYLLCSGSLRAQEDTVRQSIFDYLTQQEGATLLLELDMKALEENRKKTDYIPAKLTDEQGNAFELEVRTRGKFRRRRCEIPPIKLKFAKTSLREANLHKMNEIKLVLPCEDKSANEELIVREYIAYRMYESLSPKYSARARLIRLQLKDTNKKRPKKMFAMLVEHEEEVSGRLNCAAIQEWGVKPEQLNTEQTSLMALFEYMIGNTDWELIACRNVMLLQPGENEKLVPVPYDFDFSGLVAAPYASPVSECGVKTVRDRCLQGYGTDSTGLQKARLAFLEAKPVLLEWCNDGFLSSSASRDMKQFLEVFFDQLAQSEEIPEKLEFEPNK